MIAAIVGKLGDENLNVQQDAWTSLVELVKYGRNVHLAITYTS
jgi:hypothetical protein